MDSTIPYNHRRSEVLNTAHVMNETWWLSNPSVRFTEASWIIITGSGDSSVTFDAMTWATSARPAHWCSG